MELEEAEDEEWDTTLTSTSQFKYSSESEPNANNGGGKVKCVLKKILVAGFVASSAPLVLPPLVVASAIGVVVSMPYALFLASHTCTQNLMNKLLPRPQNPPLLQHVYFQPDIDNDIAHISKEEWFLKDKTKRDNEIVDEIVNENEESETTPDVVLEECCDEVKEGGGIEEEELQRETKGLFEKIRDEGRIDRRGENVEGRICRGTNESEQEIGLVVENRDDRQSLRTEGEMKNLENSQVFDCEEFLQSRNDDNIYDEVESCEHVRGNLEVDIPNDSQKPMAEETCELLDERGFQYESIPAERIRDLLIETQAFDISVDEEDSSEVTNDKTDTHENFQEEQKPTILQKRELDDNISAFENQEMQMHEDSNILDSADAGASKIADESGLPLCDEYPDANSYTIDLHNESSNVVDAPTESMEVLVSSVELDSRSSECSSGKNILCPSGEESRNEDNYCDNKDMDTIINEVESCEHVRGNLEVDIPNDSQKPMAEETCELLDERGLQYESIPAERIRDLLIETQVFDISVAEEDSSEVTNDKTDTHENFQEEPESTILQKGKLDDNISDFENQEMQLLEDSKTTDSLDADARKIADESRLPSCDENPDAYSYTIDLHDESSNVAVDPHTDSMEVLVSSVELDSRSSECSSGKNVVCPSEEILLNEGDIWKEIHAIRKIIGYEVTSQASCVDELKALYIFTGVEPPTFVNENPFDLAEINEKLHFLMSIVGIKSNKCALETV